MSQEFRIIRVSAGAGPTGPKGDQGDPGGVGPAGDTGSTAFEIAVSNGFVGTEEEWLTSLVGPQGDQGPQGNQGPAGLDGLFTAASTAEAIAGSDDTKAMTPATVAEVLPFVSARREGAAGDGVTDDTTDLQAALNGVPARGILDLEGRTYVISARLTINTKITVRNGAIIGTDHDLLIINAAGAKLERVSFTRTTAYNGTDVGAGIIVAADDVTVEDCDFTDAYSSCLVVLDGVDRATIRGGEWSNSSARQDASCVYVAAGALGHVGIRVEGVRITNSASQGIAMYNCSDSSVSGCRISGIRMIPNTTLTGWTLVTGNIYSTTDRTDGATRTLLDNGTQRTENTSTPTTPGTNQWGISGGVVYLNLGGTDPNTRTITSRIVSGYALYFYDANGGGMYRNTAENCVIDDADGFGIYVVGTGADMTIRGGKLTNVALEGSQNSSLVFAGIGVSGVDTTITDTTVDVAGSSGKVVPCVWVTAATHKLTNVVAKNGLGHGLQLWGDVTAVNCEAKSNAGVGISVSPSIASSVRLIGCRSISNTSHGIEISSASANVQVIGGRIAENTLRGITAPTAAALTIEGVEFETNGSTLHHQIVIGTVTVAAIIANRIRHSSASGLGLSVGATAPDTTVTGNVVTTITSPYTFAVPVRIGGARATVSQWVGVGTPEGAVTAVIGSTFQRTDGGAGTSLYVKETGTGNTGWVAK